MNPPLKKQLNDNLKLYDNKHCYTLFTKRYLGSFISSYRVNYE